MAIHPSNYAPVSIRSRVAHQPGQKAGEKIKDGRDYIVEFQDDLLSTQGWSNPRLDGCEITGLFQNKFSPGGTPQQLGGIKSPNIQHLINITQSWEGDSGNLDKNPVVQTYTNTVFFGDTLNGYEEDERFPNVGEDFSYLFINKAYTFDPDNDTFFITELLGENDDVFERVVKQDLAYASKFTFKLLDEGTENDLKQEYNVHFNAGLFSIVGTYLSCSETPYQHEMQVTTQYVAPNTPSSNYYGVRYNPYLTSNPTQNNVPFLFNSNNRLVTTGSFTVAENIDTWWWRRPRTSSYFAVGTTLASHNSASGLTFFNNGGEHLHTSGDYSTSIFGFFYRLIGVNASGVNTDFVFEDPLEQAEFGLAPAKQDLHILTFNDARGCIKDIQTELRYGRNTTQALRHFGSISLSPGRKIPVPGGFRGAVTLNSNAFSINSKVVGPAFEEYVKQTSYVAAQLYSYYTWFVGGEPSASEVAAEAYVPPGIITGSGNFFGAKQLEKFTVSKLIKRPNVIMADINKVLELFDGIGGRGFLCIPENLNPAIKNNLDYFLKKAELIDRGPNRKNLAAKSPRILRTPKALKRSHLNPGLNKKN